MLMLERNSIYIIIGLVIVVFILLTIQLILIVSKAKMKKRVNDLLEDKERLTKKHDELYTETRNEISKLTERCEVAERGKEDQRSLERIVYDTLEIMMKRMQS